MNEFMDPIETKSEAPAASSENHITKALRSPLFMTVALLLSIAFGFDMIITFLMQGTLIPDIILLLLIIGLWITRSSANSTPLTNAVSAAGMNLVSGTVKAVRIIALVLSILCMLASAAFLIMIPIVKATPDIAEAYMGETQAVLYMIIGQSFSQFDSPAMVNTFNLYAAIVAFVCGLLFLIVGYCLFLKKAHRFTYTLCNSMKNGTTVDNAKPLANWTLVIGILCAIQSLTSGLGILADGLLSAALIVSSCWLRTYFGYGIKSADSQDSPNPLP